MSAHERCAPCGGSGRLNRAECERCDGYGETGHPRKFTRTRLAEMQAEKLPRLVWSDMMSFRGGTDEPPPEADVAALRDYFAQFTPSTGRCPCCLQRYARGMLDFFDVVRLEWGIAHGEAHCSGCRYPYRVLHRKVGPIASWQHGLAYHPDDLSFSGENPC